MDYIKVDMLNIHHLPANLQALHDQQQHLRWPQLYYGCFTPSWVASIHAHHKSMGYSIMPVSHIDLARCIPPKLAPQAIMNKKITANFRQQWMIRFSMKLDRTLSYKIWLHQSAQTRYLLQDQQSYLGIQENTHFASTAINTWHLAVLLKDNKQYSNPYHRGQKLTTSSLLNSPFHCVGLSFCVQQG